MKPIRLAPWLLLVLTLVGGLALLVARCIHPL
jgi:hypothetical protein